MLRSVLKRYFFGFIEALASKGIFKNTKELQKYKGITSAMECADLAAFTFATGEIISCLLCKFISPEVSVISLFANLRVFLVRLGNSSEFLSFFFELSEEITRRKIKYLLR